MFTTYFQRGRRLLFLFSNNAAGTVLSQVAALIAIPIQLKFLGVEQFGLLMLFYSFVAAGSLADLGIGPTVVRFIARTERHRTALQHVISSSFTVILMLAAVVVLASFFAAWLYEVYKGQILIAGSLHPYELTALIAYTVSASMLMGLGFNILRGLGLYWIFGLAETTVRLSTVTIVTFAAVISKDPGVTLLAYSVSTSLFTGILLLYVSKKVGVKFRLTANLRYFKRKMFHFARWVWAQAFFGFLGSQADRLIIAATMNLSTLAVYSIAMSVANAVMAGLTAGSGFLLPEAAKRIKDKFWVAKAYCRYTLLFSAATAFSIAIATPLLHPVLTLWLNENIALQVLPILLPIMWTISSAATSIPGTQFMNAVGFTKFGAILGLANNSILLAALLFAGTIAGLQGVIGAKLLSIPIGFFARAVTAHHVFGLRNPLWQAFKMVWPTVLGATVILPLSWKFLIG